MYMIRRCLWYLPEEISFFLFSFFLFFLILSVLFNFFAGTSAEYLIYELEVKTICFKLFLFSFFVSRFYLSLHLFVFYDMNKCIMGEQSEVYFETLLLPFPKRIKWKKVIWPNDRQRAMKKKTVNNDRTIYVRCFPWEFTYLRIIWESSFFYILLRAIFTHWDSEVSFWFGLERKNYITVHSVCRASLCYIFLFMDLST